MTQSERNYGLEFVRELGPLREGQVRALYRADDGLFEVSTVPDTYGGMGGMLDEFLGVLGAMIGPGNPAAEYAADRNPECEETMAFPCAESGERISSMHVVAAQGEGSRERVLEMLAGGQRWRLLL